MSVEWIDTASLTLNEFSGSSPVVGLDTTAGVVGNIPHYDFPGDGGGSGDNHNPDYINLPEWNGEAYVFGQGIREDIVEFIRELVIGLGVELIIGEPDQTQEQWQQGTNPQYTLTEVALGNYIHKVGTGQSSETAYTDIAMTPAGKGTHIGHHYKSNGDVLTWVAQDRDGNGYTDVVYKQDADGDWWKAENTTNGEPNWQRSTAPKPIEPEQEAEEVDG